MNPYPTPAEEHHPLADKELESGMDLKAYAERAGKAHSTLFKKVAGWRVLGACDFHVEIDTITDSWRNLAEIHAAPKWPSAFRQNSRFSHSHPWEIIFR